MEEIVFKGDPQTDSETFILKQTTLTITGRAGPENERTIRLSDMSPEFEVFKKRFKRFYLGPLFLSGLMSVVAWRLFQYDSILVVIAGGIVAGLALGFLLMLRVEPIEGVRFKNAQGEVEFTVHRPSKAAYAYSEFISALVSRIKRVKDVTSRE